MFNIIKDVDKYVATRANSALKDFANFVIKMQEDTSSIEKLTSRILKESGYMEMLENEKTTEADVVVIKEEKSHEDQKKEIAKMI